MLHFAALIVLWATGIGFCLQTAAMTNSSVRVILDAWMKVEIGHDSKLPMIPFILHQSWKTSDLSSYSSDAVQMQAKNSVYLKVIDFLKVLWTDVDILALIEQSYPDLLNYFNGLNMNIKRADLSRYLILHKYGGVYMDLDIELRKNLSSLFTSTAHGKDLSDPPCFVSYVSREYLVKSGSTPFAGNAFLGSVANSSILWDMVQHIVSYSAPKGRQPLEVLAHTGPIGLGSIVKKHKMQTEPSTYQQSCIRILPYKMVGNLIDNPSHAAHVRKSTWKGVHR